MQVFQNRVDAGKQLAEQLKAYSVANQSVVIGLARGGVVIASEIAKVLRLPLDVICPRKISLPSYPEYAIGAVTETGSVFLTPAYSKQELKPVINQQIQEAKRRSLMYRSNHLMVSLENKIVILADDGIATGFTMQAAIAMVRDLKPAQIILATPVAAATTLHLLQNSVDAIFCLIADENFMAVGQYYNDFPQIEDSQVIELLTHHNAFL